MRRSTQSSLYVLTICAILSGWLVVSASPLPVPTRFFDLFVIPNIAPPDLSLFAGAALAHRLAIWGIAVLVALHVAGALKHHFVDRDDVLTRMAAALAGTGPAARLRAAGSAPSRPGQGAGKSRRPSPMANFGSGSV